MAVWQSEKCGNWRKAKRSKPELMGYIYLCYLNEARPFYRNLKKYSDLLHHPAVG